MLWPSDESATVSTGQEPSPAPSVVRAVLARLPEADRQRAVARQRQIGARVAALVLASLLLLACAGPQASNVATRALASLLAAAETWRVLVSILLGGLSVVPAVSAACLLGVSVVLWQRLLAVPHRGVR